MPDIPSKELNYIISTHIRESNHFPAQQLNWQEFERIVVGNRIVSYALSKIPSATPDQTVYHRLQTIQRQSLLSSLQTTAEIFTINKLATEHQIPVYFYKGQVWSQWIYDDLKMRSPGDIDLFVPKKDLFRFIQALIEQENYTIHPYHRHFLDASDSIKGAFLQSDYHIPLEKKDSEGKTTAIVEVHWEIAYPRLCFDFKPESFGPYQTVFNFSGHRIPMLVNEYQFLMLLVNHGGKENWKQLRYVIDLKAYMDKFGVATNWKMVDQLAHEKGISKLLYSSLSLLKSLGYDWRPEYPDVNEKVNLQRYFGRWQELPPEPKNMSWRYFLHALRVRDKSHRPDIIKSHLRFLSLLRLHSQKLLWHRQHPG